MATSGNDKDTAVAQLAKIKLATDAYNDAVKELNNATDEDQKALAEQSVENAQYTLDLLTKDFDKNKETLYNQLTSEMEKMKRQRVQMHMTLPLMQICSHGLKYSNNIFLNIRKL